MRSFHNQQAVLLALRVEIVTGRLEWRLALAHFVDVEGVRTRRNSATIYIERFAMGCLREIDGAYAFALIVLKLVLCRVLRFGVQWQQEIVGESGPSRNECSRHGCFFDYF